MTLKALIRNIEEKGFSYANTLVTLDRNKVTRAELYDLFVKNGSLIDYGEPESVTVSEPDAVVEELPEMDRWQGTYTISKPFVGVVNDARIVGSPPLAISGSNYIADASVSPNVQTLNVIKSIPRTPKRIVSGNGKREPIDEGVLLHNSWHGGYFHWVAETLTRLESVEKYIERTGRKPKLIVGPDLNSFQAESLALLGYDRDDLVHWRSAYCEVERLVVPSMRREIDPPNPSPFSHWWLRNTLRRRALDEIDTSRFSNRVYISRNDADTRRVLNESDLATVLDKYGFETYQLSKMKVEETIALFAQADCIVAPHGAGLADLIHTDDVALIEFMPEDRVNGVYYMLAKQVGGWYGYIGCQTHGSDITVPPQGLERSITAAIDRDQTVQTV